MRTTILTLLSAALLAPLAVAATSDIQPGDLYNGICTLNFVFDGQGSRAGKTYIGTAAHCIDSLGESASTTGSSNFGTVVYVGDPGAEANGIPGEQLDFALIEVKTAFLGRVKPDVLGHPGMPTGFTTSTTTSAGDVLYVSGYGMGFDATAQTRENRAGVLLSDTSRHFVADTLAVWGDSGGGILHSDGRALGVVSQYALGYLPPATDEGPTVEGVLNEMRGLGFPLALRTAS